MDDNAELQRFAELLMTKVRDQAIAECDRLARGEIRGPSGERWRAAKAGSDTEVALLRLIPDIVDQTLFELLDAIDNDVFPILWRGEDGSVDALREIGKWEMAGWLAGGDWPRTYSAQRRNDNV
jgi:hypothetical protein